MVTTPRNGQSHRSRSATPRFLRPNVILGQIIPLLLIYYAYRAIKLILIELIIESMLLKEKWLAGLLSLIIVIPLLCLVVWSFLVMRLSKPERIPFDPPLSVLKKEIVYECDNQGDPLRCFEKGCNGAWKPIRSRHCRDCGTCQLGFDHHCAFVGCCITAITIKSFTLFLASAIPLLSIGFSLLARPVWIQLSYVLRSTWNSRDLDEMWWSNWYSWIGGPVYRYVGGIVVGYNILASRKVTAATDFTSSLQKSISTVAPLFILIATIFIVLIACAILFVVIRNALDGRSTIEEERFRRWKRIEKKDQSGWDPRLRLWIPFDDLKRSRIGSVVTVDPSIALFDLGKVKNWHAFLGSSCKEWLVPWTLHSTSKSVMSYQIAPSILKELEMEARNQI